MSSTPISPLGMTRCGRTEFTWGSRTYIMGIINVTPDSFSGDGLGNDLEAAVAQGVRFVEEGADILDVGGESTRPGSAPVSVEEELRRVIPVVERLAREVSVPISIDTYKGDVARRALQSGAQMLNDVWGLKHDPSVAHLAAETGVPLILMHNQQGTVYQNLMADILESLGQSIQLAQRARVKWENIIVDPGIGFGKNLQQNLEVMRHLRDFTTLGRPLLLGTSRKSMIGLTLNLPAEERLEGTAATIALGIASGVDIVRVHDVKAMTRVARMTDAIVRGHYDPKAS